jgi:methionine synthase I (cobalamin-dependent)
MLLDAAMGTRLIDRGLDLNRDDPALWNVDRPELVLEIHRLDVAAGADAVTTNTFGANARWLARFGREDEVREINLAAVSLAREAAGPDRLVLGCIGPTALRTPDFGELTQQAHFLGLAGVDALILETVAADEPLGDVLFVARFFGKVPIIISFALVADGDPLPGIDEHKAPELAAVGWNCIPPGRAVELPDHLRRPIGLPLVMQPSGPWLGGDPRFEPTPGLVSRLLDGGVRLFGGCCGTTERDIAALRSALGPSPHVPDSR